MSTNRSTVLAPDSYDANSATFEVCGPVKVGMFTTDAGGLFNGIDCVFDVMEATPGTANPVCKLTTRQPSVVLAGPGVYHVHRPDIKHVGIGIGVFIEYCDDGGP